MEIEFDIEKYARKEEELTAHEQRMADIDAEAKGKQKEFDDMTTTQKTAFTLSAMTKLGTSVMGQNKKMFKISKVAAATPEAA